MAEIIGDDADNELVGTGENDTVTGGLGNDTISALGGNDTVYGDYPATVNDTVGGDDVLAGGDGDDVIYGGGGGDEIEGGAGSDSLYGGAGDDLLDERLAESDRDLLDGGEGNDNITDTGGIDDTLLGGAGDDTIDMGSENSRAEGGDGNDVLFDGGLSNALSGGDGNDTIQSLGGNGIASGDAGQDLLLHAHGAYDAINGQPVGTSGSYTLDGGAGEDTLALFGGGTESTGSVTLTGGAGTDLFYLLGDLGTTEIVVSDLEEDDQLSLGEAREVDFGSGPLTTTGYYTEANLAAFNEANGTSHATPLDWLRADFGDDGVLNQVTGLNMSFGNVTSASQLTAANTGVTCFAADVLIETDHGLVAAGHLRVGDMIRTRDAGFQPLRWTGARNISAEEIAATPNLRPIRIRAGALGEATPSSDLVVSPQHRVLVRSKIAQRMFGTDEVLVAAKQLLQLDGIEIAHDIEAVTYVHFLFDDHQIVWSNGAETESLYTGEQALKMVGETAREEIFTIFPELRTREDVVSARPLIPGKAARRLAERHAQNGKPLVA